MARAGNHGFAPEHVDRNNQILAAIAEGRTQTSVAKQYGLSKSRVGVILRKGKRLGLYKE